MAAAKAGQKNGRPVNLPEPYGGTIVNVREKPIWKFGIRAEQTSRTRSVAEARAKSVIIDEPIPRGGTDEGPMPGHHADRHPGQYRSC